MTGPSARFLLSAAVRLGIAGLMIASMAGGIVLLHARADAGRSDVAAPPLPVATQTARLEPGYRVTDRFVGRLEPARRTSLAFERSGLVTEILADEGDVLAAGQVVARLDVDPLNAERRRLEAEKAAVAADLDLARRTLDRQRTLTAQGHASAQRLDETRLAVTALESRVLALEAAILTVDIDIAKSALRTPFAGTVSGRHVDEGAVVTGGRAVVDLLETDRPQVRVGVSPEAARAIEAGAAVTLEAGGRALAAGAVRVRPDLATDTRTATLLIDVAAAEGAVFGDVVALHVDRFVADPGLWLPLDALVEGQRGLWTVLTVVDGAAGPTVAREAVELLRVADGRAFVRGTLVEGARVVVGHPDRVVPGQAVALAGPVS
ncbi:MAG: efflux RND transporter periplasmic adaptor subunit [Inquilinaceae bacterium]